MRKKRRLNLPPIDKETAKLVSRAWSVFAAMLTLSLLLQLFVTPHGYFKYDGYMFFYALFGLIACGAFVLLSALLSFLLKRAERYYEEDK